MADDDLIRRGDALKAVEDSDWPLEAIPVIAALPAQGVMSAVGNLPAVHAAHEIRLGVLAETIDPLQGYVTKEDCALYVSAILAALEPASGGVEKPVAWMRQWAFDGNEGTRGNRPPGWALHAVTQIKLMETDVPLYTTPAPVATDRVDALVKAAEQLRAARNTKSVFTGQPSRGDIEAAMNAVDAALAAIREGHEQR